jgi:hypothetical protein
MELINFKQGQPEAIGTEINMLGRKYRVLSCDKQKVYLGLGFGIDRYHIVAEEIPEIKTAE